MALRIGGDLATVVGEGVGRTADEHAVRWFVVRVAFVVLGGEAEVAFVEVLVALPQRSPPPLVIVERPAGIDRRLMNAVGLLDQVEALECGDDLTATDAVHRLDHMSDVMGEQRLHDQSCGKWATIASSCVQSV